MAYIWRSVHKFGKISETTGFTDDALGLNLQLCCTVKCRFPLLLQSLPCLIADERSCDSWEHMLWNLLAFQVLLVGFPSTAGLESCYSSPWDLKASKWHLSDLQWPGEHASGQAHSTLSPSSRDGWVLWLVWPAAKHCQSGMKKCQEQVIDCKSFWLPGMPGNCWDLVASFFRGKGWRGAACRSTRGKLGIMPLSTY